MSSLVRQVGLVPAGCQPWNQYVVSGSGPTFAYCATLAVYIYEHQAEYEEYKLTSINASHSKTILCLSWNKDNPNLFATGGADGKIFVWDVEKRKVISQHEKLPCVPKCLCWLPEKAQSSILAFCNLTSPVYLWDTTANSISMVSYTNGFDSAVTLLQWHHTDSSKFVTGHTDGSLSLFYSGKRNKHCLRPSDESTSGDVDPVLAALWDPLSTDYLLVSRKMSGMQLLDMKALSVITEFIMPSKMVSVKSLSWIDSAPGMFLTGDHETGTLRLWSVSRHTPLESINLKPTGFHCLHTVDTLTSNQKDISTNELNARRSRLGSTSSVSLQSYSVPPAKVVCTFGDGGIGLYNLQSKKWEFLREQGHVETIFDCKFKPNDPKRLATASFDGTVKVWSVDDLTTVQTTTGNEGVIYSISWAPADLNCLACGTRKRGMFVWDLTKSKIIRRFKEHDNNTIYCVAWNQRDSHRLASCSDDGLCVVRRLDGEVLRKYQHPESAFGCEWSIIDKDLLATACNDGIVRVWNFPSKDATAYRELRGHKAKVFHVRWHPLIRNILASGSDDKTIRVWEIESQTCTALLEGHTSNVRGLAWNHEIAFLLASGSWDSTLRLWDVRDGKCVETVADHGADVYGLAAHPNNPFTLATTSRDSTVRIWSLENLTQTLFLRLLSGESCNNIVGGPEECMKPGAPLKLSGDTSRQVRDMLAEKKNNDCVKLRWFSELFCSSRGLENLWDLVCTVRGQREVTLSHSYKSGIIHTKHLTKYNTAEARESEHILTKSNKMLRQKDQSLMRAVDLHLKLGNVQRHCELLVELGEWERAIALAPGVSIAFWSSLAQRYAALLESEQSKDAVAFHITTGHIREAVENITSQGELQDALLVAQSAHEGNAPRRVTPDDAHNGQSPNCDDSHNNLVAKCCEEMSARHYKNSSPYSAASIHLVIDDKDAAIDCLVRSSRLALALCLARNLKGTFPAAAVAARMLARKLVSVKAYDVAVKLLLAFDPPSPNSTATWSTLHDVCALCDVTEEETKARIHALAGLPSPKDCSTRATALESSGDLKGAMRHYILSDEQQKGLELAVQLLTARLRDDAKWTVDAILDDLGPAFSVPSSLLKSQKNKNLRTKLLAVAAYFGALLAIRRRYDTVVKPLFQHAKSLIDLSFSSDSTFPLSPSEVQEELRAWINQPELCVDAPDAATAATTFARIRSRAGNETQRCMTGLTVVDSSNLPSHSQVCTSTISGRKISGAPFILEDGRSLLSLNEAVMWAKVNQFSPTSSGERICPF